MKIGIVGYGRMGQVVSEICEQRDHSVVCRVDKNSPDADFSTVAEAVLAGAIDRSVCVIEFALPGELADRMNDYTAAGCSVVLGTTGWETERDAVLETVRVSGSALIWGSNFSVGANLYLRTARFAARLANRTASYDAGIVELHHSGKADSPSGTALSLASAVQSELGEKTSVQTETLHRRINQHELHVVSGRVGTIPGTHTLYLDSIADTVELTHRARSRRGFALGSVLAAEWLDGKTGDYTVDQFFDYLFAQEEA